RNLSHVEQTASESYGVGQSFVIRFPGSCGRSIPALWSSVPFEQLNSRGSLLNTEDFWTNAGSNLLAYLTAASRPLSDSQYLKNLSTVLSILSIFAFCASLPPSPFSFTRFCSVCMQRSRARDKA